MNKIVKLFAAIIVFAAIGSLSACKKTFDQPPGATDDINIVANTTIQTLKALHTVPRAYDVINDNIIISGIVIANDKSGNFYKQLFIQDTTGAIQIKIEANSLYGTYPVGRRVFIYCKDLTISDYNNTIQLGVKATIAGSPSLEGIPSATLTKYLKGGSINNPVVPIPVTLGQLTSNMQDRYMNALIKLDGYEFKDTTDTYSDTSSYKSTVNDTIGNCSFSTIIRTSAYSNFAAQRVPSGNGSITAIYTVFGSTKQFVIRDPSDVQFTGSRCGGPPPNALLFENFEAHPANTTAPYSVLSITGWKNLSELGTFPYTVRTFSGSKYAYTSAFGVPVAKTWLVTKAVNLNATATETLTFDTKQDFLLSAYPGGTNVASDLKVLYSLNYDGVSDPWTNGTWTPIMGANLSPGSTSSAFPPSYTNSGNIDLSSYSGTIYIAFVNEGGTTVNKTSAWEIDNIKIIGN
ncbi:MAG: hypothetical protein H7258_04230 [Ferruginibacter sp.]|nr:hypothetical protein [Ferruginibacter sp.]